MSIFAIITGFVMANYRAGQQGDELRIAAQLVASNIRRAQTSALGGSMVSCCIGGSRDGLMCGLSVGDQGCPGGKCVTDLPRGFGLHLSSVEGDNRKMVYFADLDGEYDYDVGEEVRVDAVSSGKFVSVSGVSPASGGVLDIVFVPPKPTAYFNNSTDESGAEIVLQHAHSGATRTVTVNRLSGQVSAE